MSGVRAAQPADLDHIADLVGEFHAIDRWSGLIAYDRESFRAFAELLIERGVILLSDHGLLGLTVSPSIYNRSLSVCAELFFWAPDGQGDALRRAGEQWAAERASVLVMGCHEPGPVERISNWYRRAGYAPIGRQFARAV